MGCMFLLPVYPNTSHPEPHFRRQVMSVLERPLQALSLLVGQVRWAGHTTPLVLNFPIVTMGVILYKRVLRKIVSM